MESGSGTAGQGGRTCMDKSQAPMTLAACETPASSCESSATADVHLVIAPPGRAMERSWYMYWRG